MKTKIEEGCMAMIIGSKRQSGEIVTVVKYLGSYDILKNTITDAWEVSEYLNWYGKHTDRLACTIPIASERNLMRIDGGEELLEVATENTTSTN